MNSTFAILDVMKGRKKLAKRITAGEKPEILIKARIVRQHGSDDGTSIEFELEVTECKEVAK